MSTMPTLRTRHCSMRLACPALMQCRTDLILLCIILRTIRVSLGRYTFIFFRCFWLFLLHPSSYTLYLSPSSRFAIDIVIIIIGSLPRTMFATNSSHILFRFVFGMCANILCRGGTTFTYIRRRYRKIALPIHATMHWMHRLTSTCSCMRMNNSYSSLCFGMAYTQRVRSKYSHGRLHRLHVDSDASKYGDEKGIFAMNWLTVESNMRHSTHVSMIHSQCRFRCISDHTFMPQPAIGWMKII